MSTEQTTGRRPSYGNDLDATGTTYQPIRHRTSSNENIIYDERFNRNSQSPARHSQRIDDHSPSPSSSRKSSDGINVVVDTRYQQSSSSQKPNSVINSVVDTQYQRSVSPPKTNSVISSVVDAQYQRSSSSQKTNSVVNAVVDTKYQRSPSPSAVDNSNNYDQRHRSTYLEEDDRNKYAYESEKMSYGNGTSAFVNIPVISQTKQSNTSTGGYDIPIERRNSRERQIDITGRFFFE